MAVSFAEGLQNDVLDFSLKLQDRTSQQSNSNTVHEVRHPLSLEACVIHKTTSRDRIRNNSITRVPREKKVRKCLGVRRIYHPSAVATP